MKYIIHEVADIAGISVRTLHHYDQIGLLIPAAKSSAGYRLYNDSNLATLQQIMMLKELGFSLNHIKQLCVNNALSDNVLLAQRKVLEKKKTRLMHIISVLDNMIKKEDQTMEKNKMFAAFDMAAVENAQKQYADEVQNKYPKALVDESKTKTSEYNKKDWQRVMQRQSDIFSQFASKMQDGEDPAAKSIRALVLAFQSHINESFYTCDDECLLGLGELYVTDERFAMYFENIAAGLAQYIHKAIQSCCK